MVANNDEHEFYDAVVGNDNEFGDSEVRILEAANGMELEVEIYGPDRDSILDKISQFPDELLALMTSEDIDTPEEAQEEADVADVLSGMNKEAVSSFREIVVLGVRHTGELTSIEMQDIVHEMDLQVLFPFAMDIIEMGLENESAVSDFRMVNEDKSS